jgi:hypothetical protein
MSETARLLERIEEGIFEHGGDLMAALQSLLDRERAAQKPWWKFW